MVVGHGRDEVSAEAARYASDVQVIVQDRQVGTGHAVRMVIETLGDLPGVVVVTYGDMPLLRARTLAALVREHRAASNAVTVLTARVADPSGYGRIIRDDGGSLAEIVEEADATPAQRAIDEINSGCYAFDGDLLGGAAKRVANGNMQGQEYLTDVVAILRGDGHLVGTVMAADPAEIQGVNDRVQLAQAQRAYNSRLLEGWMRAGVTIMDPSATYIDADVTLAPDAEILPGTHLEGWTVIGPGARIGPGCVLRDTVVGASATVIDAVCESMEIEPGANVRGPFPSPTDSPTPTDSSSPTDNPSPTDGPYVNQQIIDDIRKKDGSSKFNVTKLLRLIEEMNINYEQRNSYAAHALLRAILDHIPPILGYPDFKAAANNYSWQRTDRRYVKKLLDFRDQGDDALHRQISERVDVLDFDDMPASVYKDTLLQVCAAQL